ncbi:general odorant-binding protein 67-like [Phlebotomus argentipes]|uniref:general odorant-binding protein 67-like n=1 Tax=Phlebotomus argentipes TaxID=94469 RepID=UPI002893102B|nr:general odorant-binding protein 67-like [Phlebotomus argentipes]
MVRIVPFLLAMVAFVAVVIDGQQDCRQPPPLRINPRECCQQPKLIKDAIFADCFQRFSLKSRSARHGSARVVRSPRRGPPPGFPTACVAECVFNNTNLSVENPESISELLEQSPTDIQDWAPIFSEGFAACSKIVPEKLRENDVDKQIARQLDGCSPLPGAILTCLHSHVFSRCPQSAWKNVPECGQLRDFFTACPIPPFI